MATNLNRIDFVLIAHLQATWRRAGRENVDPWLAVEREKRTFPLICQFDPTDGLYHAWLSAWRQRLWHSAGFSASLDLRQLDEVCAALARFHAIKDTLPLGHRDIGQFHTVDDLLSVVPTRVAQSRRRMESEALKARAHKESDILFREGRWMVVRLKGFVAARFWGLGTRWCTTTAEHTYWSYAAKGEMLVFLTPHGKYQLATFSQMLRDERDDPVDMKVFRAAPTVFAELLRLYRRRRACAWSSFSRRFSAAYPCVKVDPDVFQEQSRHFVRARIQQFLCDRFFEGGSISQTAAELLVGCGNLTPFVSVTDHPGKRPHCKVDSFRRVRRALQSLNQPLAANPGDEAARCIIENPQIGESVRSAHQP